MDGVGTVSQEEVPGISVGRRRRRDLLATVAGAGKNVTAPPPPTFIYDFVVDAPGSYWYHDHSLAFTYVDGLREF